MLFHHFAKFGAKMLLDAELLAEIEIQDGGRQPSWIFENLILSNRSPWAGDFYVRQLC